MRFIRVNFILSIILVWLITGCAEQKAVPGRTGPSYTAAKTTEPPVIDGILTDTCWKKAETGSFVLSRDGGRPAYPTTLRAAWDDENLYIGFECQDPDAASTVTERDGPVSSQEYVSVYIDADADSLTYVTIDVAPTGVVSDAFILYGEGDRKIKSLDGWNCDGLRVSVSIYGGGSQPGTEDRFWTVEMSVPLNEFLTARRIPPSEGDAWRVNFYRMEQTGGKDFSAFAPTGSENGHKPEKFVWLLFGG